MVSETLSTIYLLSMYDTPNPHHPLLEPAEHIFGSMRVTIGEPTVHEMKDIEEKGRFFTEMYESGLVSR